MTSILLSEAQSRLARAVHDLFVARGEQVSVAGGILAGDDTATLVVTDLAPALMVRAVPAGVKAAETGLSADRLAELDGLITAAATRGARIVLVSGLQPLPGVLPVSAAERDAQRLEMMVAAQAASHTVILRVSDVMDPADPELRASIRALIDASPAATWPPANQVQVIALADLAAATAAATHARGVEGKWFDIVHPEAASRVAVQSEAQRIARLLVDPAVTEVQCRPAYVPVNPMRDGTAGAAALHAQPRASVFVLLAQAIQGMVADGVREGTIAPIRPPMPALHRALETGGLPLAGRLAVVTGATGHIGRNAARMLVRLGADVIGVARGAGDGAAMEQALPRNTLFCRASDGGLTQSGPAMTAVRRSLAFRAVSGLSPPIWRTASRWRQSQRG